MNSIIKLHFIPYSAELNENRNNHFSKCCKRWIWGEIYHVSLEKMKNTQLPENFLDVWAD